jgi:spore germination protein YaaH
VKTSSLIAVVVFTVGVIALVILVVATNPWLGPEEKGEVAAGPSATPTASDTSLEEPLVLENTPSPVATGKRLFEVCAWSRGARGSLTNAIRAGALDEVDFDWYHSRPNGTLVSEGEKSDLVAEAKGKGVRVLATVTNRKNHRSPFDAAIAGAILATAQTRSRHVDALVSLCLQKGYDGIDLDWEMVDPAQRDDLSLFVEELAGKLHAKDKLLSMPVFPKNSEPGDWDSQKSEDYTRLGKAVDEFKVMTYSFSGPWGKPGAQMPLDWADANLDFAESVVPPEKIYMGISFIGFDWSGKSAEIVSAKDVADLQERFLCRFRRDPGSKEVVLTYVDAHGRRHTAIYLDSRALAAKLDLLVKDHPRLAGIAIWVMGEEQPEFWNVIRRDLSE